MGYPKISILVAAYKSEKVIQDTINHYVKEVKYPNFEVLFGVDTEEDRTINIVRKAAKKHKKIIVDFSKKRRGIINTMNSLLMRAKGDIIVKFDAEFRFLNPSTCLHKLIRYYKSPDVGAVAFNMKHPKYLDKEIVVSRLVKAQSFMSQVVCDWKRDRYPIIRGRFDMPLIVHSFRRGIFTKIDRDTINDDAEFAYKTLDKGFEIRFAKDIYAYALDEPANLLQVFHRQRRTRVGWIKTAKRRKLNFKKYYASLFLYLIFNFYNYSIYELVSLFYFAFAYSIAMFGAFFKINEKITKIWLRK